MPQPGLLDVSGLGSTGRSCVAAGMGLVGTGHFLLPQCLSLPCHEGGGGLCPPHPFLQAGPLPSHTEMGPLCPERL